MTPVAAQWSIGLEIKPLLSCTWHYSIFLDQYSFRKRIVPFLKREERTSDY